MVLFAFGFIGVLNVKGISLREKLMIGLSWLTASLPAETFGFVFGSDSQVFFRSFALRRCLNCIIMYCGEHHGMLSERSSTTSYLIAVLAKSHRNSESM
jgi:hypothetical protein